MFLDSKKIQTTLVVLHCIQKKMYINIRYNVNTYLFSGKTF
jgi:hypothetical protein